MKFLFLVCLLICLTSCIDSNPNQKTEERIEQKQDSHLVNEDFNYAVIREVYVPIYSDIYSQSKDTRTQLTATLSIRNTSRLDSLFIRDVSYYDTSGKLVRTYLEAPIFLKPLETIEYVIEENDTSGGTGANFLITWGAKKAIKPLFQAVMVGINGQQGFSFTTDGVEIDSN